jgi:DNA-binding response OmpR family regulator
VSERILLIDDDERLAAMLGEYLSGFGLQVVAKPDAASGMAALRAGVFDAVLLDVMLPDRDGFELCRELRAASDVPILMLTARGDETDRIVGLELGADDYLPKPFNPRELLARLRAVLRRRGGSAAGARRVLRFGRLELDLDARVVRLDSVERPLTSHQFELLRVLAENAGRVLSRDALMEKVRGDALEAFDRSIDVHVSRIRAAIEDDPRHPRRILTVRGAGYVFARSQDGEGS